MDIGSWIILAVALAALCVAVYSTIAIRSVHKRVHKLALFGELANWATDFTLCEGILDQIYVVRRLGEKSRAVALAAKWSAEIELLITRIKYIEETSHNLGYALGERFTEVRETLGKYREVVSQQIDGKISDEKAFKDFNRLQSGIRGLLHRISQGTNETRLL